MKIHPEEEGFRPLSPAWPFPLCRSSPGTEGSPRSALHHGPAILSLILPWGLILTRDASSSSAKHGIELKSTCLLPVQTLLFRSQLGKFRGNAMSLIKGHGTWD